MSALLGALSTGIPLYIKLRNATVEIDKKRAELQLEVDKKRAEQVRTNKIDTEAEWKRILEYRDAELITLRARDEAQDRQIKDLFDKHVECEKDKARNEARLEGLDKYYGAQIKDLKAEIEALKAALKEQKNAVSERTSTHSDSSSGSVRDQGGP
jgi:DNA-binding helix-hairpin-helix protein with protein kinase domain